MLLKRLFLLSSSAYFSSDDDLYSLWLFYLRFWRFVDARDSIFDSVLDRFCLLLDVFDVDETQINILSLIIDQNLRDIESTSISSLTRKKYLDVDDIAIFIMSNHHNFVMLLLLCYHFVMNDHYNFVMILVLCHLVFVYTNRQIINAYISWQSYIRI